jgi:hypothetical protein
MIWKKSRQRVFISAHIIMHKYLIFFQKTKKLTNFQLYSIILNKEVLKMKRSYFIGIVGIFFMFAACDSPAGGGTSPQSTDLQKYQDIGRIVAAKTWSADYDCSNFSTQFYQNCYRAGLSSRVRAGISGGNGFSSGNHTWNSVLIDGQWVDWEPQSNSVHIGHIKTSTSPGAGWGTFTEEDFVRILYELIGRNVPTYIIDSYEIDDHIFEDSPFNSYFNGYCLTDDPSYNQFVSKLMTQAPNNGDGVLAISNNELHLLFAYKLNDKYYGVVNLEENDPLNGRNIINQNGLRHDFTTATEFIKIDFSFK